MSRFESRSLREAVSDPSRTWKTKCNSAQDQSSNEDSRWQKDKSVLGTKTRTRSVIWEVTVCFTSGSKFRSVVPLMCVLERSQEIV